MNPGGTGEQDSGLFKIIPRHQWGARAPICQTALTTPVTYVVIHHSAWKRCFTPSDCALELKNIQDFHMDTRGWWDIGYSFVIGEDGNLYEGRGWHLEGAHTLHYNKDSYGICFLGSFTDVAPSTAALERAQTLIHMGVSRGYIRPDYILKGHRNLGKTDCPGDALYQLIQTWPHFKA